LTEELTRHIRRALHADDLVLGTSAEHSTTAPNRMQEALNSITKRSTEWMVTINKSKTEATIFSLSPKKELYSLKIDDKELPQNENPTYLGVTLDRKLTWSVHISNMESKDMKKTAAMKKLAGTGWGANSKILNQVYTGCVRPHLEYASTSWNTASKTNMTCLTKV